MNSTEPEPETDRGVSRGEFPTTSITYKLISFDTISRPPGHSTSSELQNFMNQLERAEKRQKETVRKEMTARLSRDEAKYRVMRGQLLSQIAAAKEKEATERAAAAKALQEEAERKKAAKAKAALEEQRKIADQAEKEVAIEEAEELAAKQLALDQDNDCLITHTSIKVKYTDKPLAEVLTDNAKDEPSTQTPRASRAASGSSSSSRSSSITNSSVKKRGTSKPITKQTARPQSDLSQDRATITPQPEHTAIAAAVGAVFTDSQIASLMTLIDLALERSERKRKREAEGGSEHRPRSPAPKRCDAQSSAASRDSSAGTLQLEVNKADYEILGQEDELSSAESRQPMSKPVCTENQGARGKLVTSSPGPGKTSKAQITAPPADGKNKISRDLAFVAKVKPDLVTSVNFDRRIKDLPGVQRVIKCTEPDGDGLVQLVVSTCMNSRNMMATWKRVSSYERYFYDLLPGKLQSGETLAAAARRLESLQAAQAERK